MRLKLISILLLFGMTLVACQEEEPTKGTSNNGNPPDTPVIRDIDENAVIGIADEIARRWELDEITEENYAQTIEDWDSVWHVYYPRRYSLEEIEEGIEKKPIPHFLIPKKENETIRVFITD